MLVTGTEFTV